MGYTLEDCLVTLFGGGVADISASERAKLCTELADLRRAKAAMYKLERCALEITLLGGHYIVCATRGALWNYGPNPLGQEPSLPGAIERASEVSDGIR
jgi:hypothetical protein